jgi:branched-chain amino acid transport system ATP-binding protein
VQARPSAQSDVPTANADGQKDAAGGLIVRGITLRFGGISALTDVTFTVPPGYITAIIGPNGAGKTSLFNVLTGLYSASEGSATFAGRDLLATPRDRLARAGVSRTFQELALLRGLTVLENVMIGGYARQGGGLAAAVFRTPRMRGEERRMREECLALLDDLGLADTARADVDMLAYGVRKRVELARALAARPRLLLLDEPAAGLNHREVDEIAGLLTGLRSRHDMTMVVVEHHMDLVLTVAHKVLALNFGKVLAHGAPADVAAHPDVVSAYLGSGR